MTNKFPVAFSPCRLSFIQGICFHYLVTLWWLPYYEIMRNFAIGKLFGSVLTLIMLRAELW